VRRLIQGLFKGARQQETTLPVSTLASHAMRRSAIGWDHTNMNWYCPLWPELDCTLGHSSDKLRMKRRLDWGDEDVHDSETSVAKTPDWPGRTQTAVCYAYYYDRYQ
jgi:hypothetical protein